MMYFLYQEWKCRQSVGDNKSVGSPFLEAVPFEVVYSYRLILLHQLSSQNKNSNIILHPTQIYRYLLYHHSHRMKSKPFSLRLISPSFCLSVSVLPVALFVLLCCDFSPLFLFSPISGIARTF